MSSVTIKRWLIAIAFICPKYPDAQPIPIRDNGLAARYPFVSTVFNRVFNNSALDPFYQKLYDLKKNDTGTVSVVHIGDSHIQAGFFSGTVRDELQNAFGNAGRGLVFPYQLAGSNAPADIMSSSGVRWDFNRLAHPELLVTPGISGFGMESDAAGAGFHLFLRPDEHGIQEFNRMTFFLDNDSSNTWMVQPDNSDTPYLLLKEAKDTIAFPTIALSNSASGFQMLSLPSENKKRFYGVSLGNSRSGVIYHSIGVNGARYDQYNIAPLFWKQLPALHADLYIISLGTNEAQRAAFARVAFEEELIEFIGRLKAASPGAAILITTAPDSYKGRSSNKVLKQLNDALTSYCNKNNIPVWDLYRITNGYGSAYSWARRGLMSRDRIHFTADGYRLQGGLLFSALAKGYNEFLEIH
jgi:lysophospholipase L1-like esterase